MAQTIQIKRGLKANLPASLAAGELAWCTDTQEMFCGTGTGRVLINDPGFSLPDTGTAGTYIKVTTDAQGRVVSGQATIANTDVTGLGTAATANTGTGAGNVPVLDAEGKLPTGIIPALAITETFVVASQAAMLALSANVGDVAIRSDIHQTFILAVEGASTLANWKQLETPTDSVTSVAGRSGAVTLTASDVGLGNVTNESKATMFTNAALTGTPTATTAAADTNSTQIATTAFVLGQAGTSTPAAPGVAAVGTSKKYSREDHVHAKDTTKANLADPTFTGAPAAPTAAADTNTTQLATTAFVIGQAGASAPLGLAAAAVVGTSKKYSREDHQHPMPTALDGGSF